MPIVTFEELQPPAPVPSPVPAATRPFPLPKWFALAQAVAVSGIPTQIVIVVGLIFLGNWPLDGGQISLEFFAIVGLLDTACIALLIRLFLMLSGETSRDVFLGRRRAWGEIWRGVLLVPVAYIGVAVVVLTLRWLAPWLQTVETNPLEHYMRTPLEAGIFLVVVMLAGGIREELQRAFVLHRAAAIHFEFHILNRRVRIGGVRWGLAVFTIVFGLLHIYEGVDAAVAIGLLGLFWGVLYIRRRSVVMPMVNHACFNGLQVVQVLIARSLGAI
jgi:membrane protease YdiL (CAAX protease family)